VLTLGVTPRPRQVDALAWQSSLRNLGYGVGGLLAALALLVHGKTPFVVLLAANAASYVLAGRWKWNHGPFGPGSTEVPVSEASISARGLVCCASTDARIRTEE
jgi:hypothetical protein